MKVSELIARLLEILVEHGDQDVYLQDSDKTGDENSYYVSEVLVDNNPCQRDVRIK